MKRIAVLTCGRSDFSILYPLIDELQKSENFCVSVVAYSTHLSANHGNTVDQIRTKFFGDLIELNTLVDDFSSYGVAQTLSNTVRGFTDFWGSNKFDWIVALGDRYEIFAALAASVPFGIKIAHLHGGEKTLGADDNKYRHAITALSTLHFTSCPEHQKRVREILDDEFQNDVYDVGSIALTEMNTTSIYDTDVFAKKFGVDLQEDTVLVTIHPETIKKENDTKNFRLFSELVLKYDFQYLVTLPNNDAGSNVLRSSLLELSDRNSRVICRESLGLEGYYCAMKNCRFMFGNTSSALIEAASFGTYAINIGSRQAGRIRNSNVFDANDMDEIMGVVRYILENKNFSGANKFQKPNGLKDILGIISNYQ